jgi:cytosine/adenosine deaminase-related metal-dependent hydrolase
MAADQLFVASLVVPIGSDPIRSGGVLVRQRRILAVGPACELARRWPHHDEVNLGRTVLLPGLVNAHTHLELSGCDASALAGRSFADWILGLGSQLRRDAPDFAGRIAAATRAGAAECLKHGVTCVGDISQHQAITRRVLRDGPLRVISFAEALGLATLRPRFAQQLRAAIDFAAETDFLRTALSPHAPYTVDEEGYREAVALSLEHDRPLCTHLAETVHEDDFLRDHSGAFRAVWERLGTWSDGVPIAGVGPIELAEAVGLLNGAALLAHVNHASDGDLDRLARGNASVVWCPRTHAYFGHPPHRWRAMLARGINVCVGTDSRASSPDLDVMEDLRLVARQNPTIPPSLLMELVTSNAAAALREDHSRGRLAPGMVADFAAFPHETSDPLAALLHEPIRCTSTWIAGRRVDPRASHGLPSNPAG